MPHSPLGLHQVMVQLVVHTIAEGLSHGVGAQLARELVAREGSLQDAPGLLSQDMSAQPGCLITDSTSEHRRYGVQGALEHLRQHLQPHRECSPGFRV
jgi:hypothetical protein